MQKKIKTLDFLMASVIFIVAAIEPISFILENSLKNYYEFWFPVLSTACLLLFGLYFLMRIIRYKACIYTKLVVIVYCLIQAFNLVAYFTKFGIEFYQSWIYPLFIVIIFGIVQIKVSRWFFYTKG